MKINYYSDLHLEFWDWQGPNIDMSGDVIILAGDITNQPHLMWINEVAFVAEKPVIYIFGNHDWYGGSFPHTMQLAQMGSAHNVHILDRESLIVEGVNIHCATLWTNFRNNPVSKVFAANRIYDFYPGNIKFFDTDVCETQYNLTVDWLKEVIKPGDIVATHFPPSSLSVHEYFKDDQQANDYFCNSLEDLILDLKPSLWIHGHTHTAFDYMIGDTRIVCNPRGYPYEYADVPGAYTTDFDPNAVIEV